MMKRTVILAATLGAAMLGVSGGANAAVTGGAAYNGAAAAPGQSLVQEVARRRICEWRRGRQVCWWKADRRFKKRWQWRRNKRGIRIRVFI